MTEIVSSPQMMIIVAGVFIIAGMVKGVAGLGLPTVSLALLTVALGLKEAMALMLIPSLATNIWQGLAGGALTEILRRLWSLFLFGCIAIWIGTGLLATADTGALTALLGVLLCIYSAISLVTPQAPPPGRWEPVLSPAAGAATGLLCGLTGSFVVPGVLYLQALGLPRDVLVQAMGVAFTISTAALAVALGGHGLLPVELGVVSAAALAPAAAGMVLGQWIRHRIPEQQFRKVFFCALLALGAYLALRVMV
ncbi:MAG: sulfite exporter TauE/SafE family protein [Methyloligellaceae bacterium]